MKLFENTLTPLWLFLLIAFTSGKLSAQDCEGEVGGALFFEDFGSGSDPGPSLPPGTTTYNYGNIGGGNYVVTNNTGLNGSLWHAAPDHTPNDVNGYCLLFDASFTPGIFYNRLFEDICPNTNYTFSVYVANIVRPFACSGSSIEPNLKFSLLDPITMVELGAVNTGGIATTEEMTWNQYAFSFTTSSNQQAILIQVTNNASGGCGNDLAIDDFTFSVCNSVHEQAFELCTLPGGIIQVGNEIYTSPGAYRTVIDLPNSCHDSIVYTNLIGNEVNNTIEYFTFCEGDSVTIDGISYFSDSVIIDTLSINGNCVEELMTYIINEEEISTNFEELNLCEGDSILIANTWVFEDGIYEDSLLSQQGCDSIVIIDLVFSDYRINLNIPTMTFDPGETIQLMVSDNIFEAADYQWSPPDFFSCSDCEAPLFSPFQSGIYSVRGYDPMSNCTDSIQFYVEVNPCKESFFPNVFSPNDDGINDDYQPYLSDCAVQISTFQIFDRWGNVIHIQNDIPTDAAVWDGRFRSQEAAIGVYTFFLDAQLYDGSTKRYMGDITLLR